MTKEEKFDYYKKHGGGVVFAWTLADSTRRYITLGHHVMEYMRMFSFDNIAYCQTVAPLTFDEINPILDEIYNKYKRIMVFLIEIPCPFTEQFYYEEYLMYCPSPRFFLQDESEWNELTGGRNGYKHALERGTVSKD